MNSTTIKDNFGDMADVFVDPYNVQDRTVYVAAVVGTFNAELAFTPKAARKLAKALKRAAKKAEAL